jgi:hypothetical protein
MAAVTSPVDGRAQYSLAAVAMANHSLGRWPFAGVQEIFPGRYVCPGEAERVYISILTEAQVLFRRFASAACK